RLHGPAPAATISGARPPTGVGLPSRAETRCCSAAAHERAPTMISPPGTTFERIQILSPAGAFTLRGNGIALLSGIGDDQPLVPQVIQFPIVFQNTSARITVAQDGSL